MTANISRFSVHIFPLTLSNSSFSTRTSELAATALQNATQYFHLLINIFRSKNATIRHSFYVTEHYERHQMSKELFIYLGRHVELSGIFIIIIIIFCICLCMLLYHKKRHTSLCNMFYHNVVKLLSLRE